MSALPREVFFEVMRSTFRITYKEICDAILSDEPIGGLSAKERGRDAARRNREFIHVAPGVDDTCWQLAPVSEAIPNLYHRIAAIIGEQETVSTIIDVLAGSGAEALRASLDDCGLDGSIYSNLISYILDGAQTEETTAKLLLHLYVVTAISGDPKASAREVIGKAYNIDYDDMTTATPPIRECEVPQEGRKRFALMRCLGKTVFPDRTYLLSEGPEGTEVGSIPLLSNCITDVERGVSRRHLRIWRDENGQWWCKGMLSLNGTVLADISTGTDVVIEPPRDERFADYKPLAHPLNVANKLILAGNTEFLVVAVGE